MKKDKKNQYGQFFTENNLVKFVLEKTNNIKNIKGDILEPSFGEGAFLKELINYEVNIDAFEIDDKLSSNIKSDKLNELYNDFIFNNFDKKYDFIIGNPPYIELCYSFYNEQLQEKIKNDYINISKGRLNLVHIFIYKSLNLLKDDGVISYLLPSSILTSPYYKDLRKIIYQQCEVEYLNEDVNFKNVAVKVCLLILRKKENTKKYFYLNNDNYFITENYNKFSNLTTLEEQGFKVKVGNIVWNQKKSILSDNENDNFLVYSHNINIDNISLTNRNNNLERKQYIKTDITYKNCIIIPRTISKKIKYSLILNNEKYVFENHTLLILNDDIDKLLNFYNKLKLGEYNDILLSFFNSSNLSTKEILSIPY